MTTVKRTGRIALLGRPNVGKSTLMNALVGEHLSIVSRHPQTTRDRILGILTTKTSQFLFYDTPGVHKAKSKLGARMNQEVRDALSMSDVILFLIEAGRELSRDDEQLLDAIPEETPFIFVVNKIDRVKLKADLFPLLERLGQTKAVAIIPVSALRKDGMPRILKELEGRIPKAAFEFDGDTLTDRSLRFVVAEYVREQILSATYQEVPHGVAVTCDEWEEKKAITHIKLTIHVDRESHKKIIIGKGGATLKMIGEKARKRAEEIVGKKVHMDTWVRVTEEWYQTEKGLIDMGYEADR